MARAHGVFSWTGSTATVRGPKPTRTSTLRLWNQELQKDNQLQNGCTQAEYQKKAFAFVQNIMPNLAQKYEPTDAAEYILRMMPPELYEAGERIKFSAKMSGKYLDLKYLIRLCGAEVFKKQEGGAPKPALVAFDHLQGHDATMIATTTGMDISLRAGSAAFAGISSGKPGRCPKCPHPRGTCIADPNNCNPPPPSVWEDKGQWRELMALRDKNGVAQSPPIKPMPVPQPSEDSLKKYREIISKRKDRGGRGGGRGGRGAGGKPAAAGAEQGDTPATLAAAAAETTTLDAFFGGIRDVTDEDLEITAVATADDAGPAVMG